MSDGWTVQLLIDCEIVVEARCPCQNAQHINLAALKDRLGPDAQEMHSDLAPRMRCVKCGNTLITLNYSPKAARVAVRQDVAQERAGAGSA
jgi:hypothetical protein